MGIVSALLLFISVLLHELSHSLVAQWKKIRVESITLFFFGGVAGITKEDIKPSSEFLMAIAGPLFSLALGSVFWLMHAADGSLFLKAITFYLYQLNFVLGLFNLVPAYPLDGGRAFRAILYGYYKDLKKATKIAATGGRIFAGLLIVLGVFGLFTGTGGGLWFILLGGFLYFIAGLSYEQVAIREVLDNIPVKELMQQKFPVLHPAMKFAEFVKKYKGRDDVFVVKDDHFFGVIEVRRLVKIPRALQDVTSLKQVAVPFGGIKAVRKEESAYSAFRKLEEQNLELLPVLDKNKLAGIVTRKAVLRRLIWELKFGEKL